MLPAGMDEKANSSMHARGRSDQQHVPSSKLISSGFQHLFEGFLQTNYVPICELIVDVSD